MTQVFFADSAYQCITPDLKHKLVMYVLRIAAEGGGFIDCPKFLPVYATSPFGTCTHVLSNPVSGVEVGGKPLTVIKDQLCNRGTRFNEHLILDAIHAKGTVPGVVEKGDSRQPFVHFRVQAEVPHGAATDWKPIHEYPDPVEGARGRF